ncbi:MAG TPA: sigma 54-interacting transcriptional regulator [Vicinamibacteria bacterium]|nr:sigma 54-interacting transcriptional regulator [Vicinamibacteria bacterium]
MDPEWSGEAKYRALLAVAQAANSQRDLSRVLEAVAGAIEDLVSVDLVGVVTHEADRVRVRALYFRSDPRRPEESQNEYVRRFSDATGAKEDTYEHSPGLRELLEQRRQTLVFNDMQAEPRLEASGMRRAGAECAVVLPLTMAEAFVGAAIFARTRPLPFSSREVSILEDVARPVTSAVANALAFEEVQRLRSQLEDENIALQEEIAATAAVGGIIGVSPGLREVLERVSRVAATDSTVLISGETGTGKELIARAIHMGSTRSRRALVKVNCAALPEGLIASELFGHEKGAFTGALERRRGRFELATGGTIFLDEVGELPQPVQVALLRVLQEREFERVGGNETLRTDARVVAATNRNLQEAVRDGRFRSDLFFRLNVFPIQVPALRERAEDIPILAEYCTKQSARKVGKAVHGITDSAMATLTGYHWPGNIRELQNVVERAVILARGRMLEPDDLELPTSGLERGRPARAQSGDERQQIEDALATAQGRVYGVGGAAEALGLAPSTLESRIRRLGIDKLAFRRRPAGR